MRDKTGNVLALFSTSILPKHGQSDMIAEHFVGFKGYTVVFPCFGFFSKVIETVIQFELSKD